ncbi:MAG: tRNA pseudouridine(55) synthase TruB [Vicinamibacterales bacterium]
MDGLLVVDKPSGPTSHDVVARLRRALREKRMGHTGTLDPMATGVLLLVVGKATRLAKFISASDKSYDAVVRFGFATDTADAQGVPIGAVSGRPMPSRDAVEAALAAFRGTFLQRPPAFSAKKIDGRRSYQLARERANARLKAPRDEFDAPALPALPAAVSVTTHSLDIVALGDETVTLRVHCSAGFYVRSLAHDLGERLGLGAHLVALRRTGSGDFGLDVAVDLETAERDPHRAVAALVPLRGMLPSLPSVVLTIEGADRVRHGRDIGLGDVTRSSSTSAPGSGQRVEPLVRLLDPHGELVALARPTRSGGALHPSVVLM